MVGMGIRNRRKKQVCRRPVCDDCRKTLERESTIIRQQRGQFLIRQSYETCGRAVHSENAQRRHGFRTSQFAPAFTVIWMQAPLAFKDALGPWIIVAVGGIDDTNG